MVIKSFPPITITYVYKFFKPLSSISLHSCNKCIIAGACNCVNMIITSYSFSEASSSTPTWLDNLRCLGTESRLGNCPANPIGVEDCTHSEDIALVCTANTANTTSKSIV